MATRLITPPYALAVSLATAKEHLKITGSDQDAMVTAWIEGITAHAEHEIGRAIVNQTWRVTLDEFEDVIEIPTGATSATVKYYDTAGIEQTINPSEYIIDAVNIPSSIRPEVNKVWPDTYGRINSVNIDVVCGYGASDSNVPSGLKLYILAKLVEQYDPASVPDKGTVQSSYIDSMLDRFKTYL